MSDDLEEAKATGEDSFAADATNPAGGAPKKRKADLNKSVDPKADEIEDTVKTPQGSNDVGLKEAVDSLFEGADLSEDFKTKTVAIFEAAVAQKATSIREELEAKFESDLEEQVDAVTSELVEKLDSYLDYVVEKWMTDNEVAIESNIKVEVAESLLSNIKTLVSEHNIHVEQEVVDQVAVVESKLQESTDKYNETFETLLSLREEKAKLERELAFRDIAEELTDTQVEKLRTLSENVSFGDLKEYKTKVEAIKENFFTETVSVSNDETEYLEEEVIAEDKKVSDDPAISAYASALSRFAK